MQQLVDTVAWSSESPAGGGCSGAVHGTHLAAICAMAATEAGRTFARWYYSRAIARVLGLTATPPLHLFACLHKAHLLEHCWLKFKSVPSFIDLAAAALQAQAYRQCHLQLQLN